MGSTLFIAAFNSYIKMVAIVRDSSAVLEFCGIHCITTRHFKDSRSIVPTTYICSSIVTCLLLLYCCYFILSGNLLLNACASFFRFLGYKLEYSDCLKLMIYLKMFTNISNMSCYFILNIEYYPLKFH
jgi:hypothetical protein